MSYDFSPMAKEMEAREKARERLRAAAPDLLDALENLMAKLEIMNGCNSYDWDGEHPWPEFEAARAAIAKAESVS